MSEEEMKALVEMNKMLQHENDKLKQQLQAYKDKEDKIKSIAKDCLFPDGDYAEVMDVGNRLLQILNEGDK